METDSKPQSEDKPLDLNSSTYEKKKSPVSKKMVSDIEFTKDDNFSEETSTASIENGSIGNISARRASIQNGLFGLTVPTLSKPSPVIKDDQAEDLPSMGEKISDENKSDNDNDDVFNESIK